jgi:DMSO/TMAO reductase YedYZ molybdopterin-dependent catalytic subunit
MTEVFRKNLSRRELLKSSLGAAAGISFAGFRNACWPEPAQNHKIESFRDGKRLGIVSFSEEEQFPMGKLFGAELDARLFTDLSALDPETPGTPTPTETFYIRTGASQLLDSQASWTVRVSGLVERPFDLSARELEKAAQPMGLHLLECAGNARRVHFGMISMADWRGVPLKEILANAKAKPESSRVLISGFDRYQTLSVTSQPGASWIFTPGELKSVGAFLATQMNGQPLTRDHGAPLRLVVPGWYGCACIKWVDEIVLVDESADATSQMREYASRTMQSGVPQLAKDYRPAVIEQAAMPIRIEKWLADGKIKYRIIGILWGGSCLVKSLGIRFNPEENYVPVDSFRQTSNEPWSFWEHSWTPKQPGRHVIRLRVMEPAVVARRLHAGYYVRSVDITEI